MHKLLISALLALYGMYPMSEQAYAMSSDGGRQDVNGIAVYVLSRGKGVPEQTRIFLQNTIELVDSLKQQGHSIATYKTRIGLEGETRYCVEFSDPKLMDDTLQQIRDMAKGIDLVNVKSELCKSRK